ncbi:MAG: VWA domain-containing protein [Candidatus Poribacteria bacterium]|nr:VWA domain-containing protein [Candidatus Poribacteria bacterium]
MYNRTQSRRRTGISFAISLLLHLTAVVVVSINVPRWYEPPPPTEPIVAAPIEVKLYSQLPRLKDARKSMPSVNMPTQRQAQKMPPSVRIPPQASATQTNQGGQPIRMMSKPLGTDVRLPSVPDALLDVGAKDDWNSPESIGEPAEIVVESPQSSTVEIRRGFSQQQASQKQEGQAESNEVRSINRDAQIAAALQTIAGDIAVGTGSPAVDIVFLLDASGSMEDNIRAVGNHLVHMVEIFQEGQLDFTIGVVTFKYSALIFPQTKDYQKYERLLRNVKCGGDERAYDAIVKSIGRVKFRPEARRRFILVTDEPCKGSYTIHEVLKRCQQAEIAVDIIGINHPLQKHLASQTGGSWFSIPGR